jgi:CO/xanthine dehydrogenase FAD-binding subunit
MLYPFDYYSPKTLNEAFKIMEESKNYKIMAGGTDLLVNIRAGKERPDVVIDIKRIEELNRIEVIDNTLRLGTTVTFNQIIENKIIKERITALYEAAEVMGCYEIRNKATIGGNIVNASPGSESGSPLYVFEAKVLLKSKEGERLLNISEFIKGVNRTDIREGEILAEVLIPLYNGDSGSIYFRGRRVKGMDLASLNLAMLILNLKDDNNRKVRLAAGAVHPTPLRMTEIEEILSFKKLNEEIIEKAKKRAAEIIFPRATSLRATPEYKKVMVGNFIEMGLKKLLKI